MKIALVGTASTNAYAPIADLEWKIWGVGFRHSYITRADRWFELHRLEVEGPDWVADWHGHMKTWTDCPVWMFYPNYSLGIEVVAFDHKPLMETYGSFFLTSSMAWMMAQAIKEGASEIGLWGINLESDEEYRRQRAGVQHFLALAKSKGIKVTTPPAAGISYQPIPYPFAQDDPLIEKTKIQHRLLLERHKAACDSEDVAVVKMHKLDGAKTELGNILRALPADVFEQIEKRHNSLCEQVSALQREALEYRDKKRFFEGAISQFEWLEHYLEV